MIVVNVLIGSVTASPVFYFIGHVLPEKHTVEIRYLLFNAVFNEWFVFICLKGCLKYEYCTS